MDSKNELHQPLAKKVPQPPSAKKVRLTGISPDKLELLLQLPVDWSLTYKKWAVMVGLQYAMAMWLCVFLFLFGDKESVKTEYVAVPHPKLVAIGFGILMLLTSLVSLVLLKQQTLNYFQFWQKKRDWENIIIMYEDPEWFNFQFKTEIQYLCPSIGCQAFGLFFNTYVPFIVAGIIIGNAPMIIGLMVGGFIAGFAFVLVLYPVSLAFNEAILNLLT